MGFQFPSVTVTMDDVPNSISIPVSLFQEVQFSEFGPPAEVTKVVDGSADPPGAGEILVEMKFAPINPADSNFVEGTYGIRPNLPARAGTEGVGRVLEVGDGVEGVEPGDHVILINRIGCWATLMTLKSGEWVKIPREADLQQSSMLKINPLTAWCLLRQILELQPGEFVLQNAANSGVGMGVAQLAREWGIPMIHFVRSTEAAEQVRSQTGAPHVFLDNDEGSAAAREILGAAQSARLALNAVGGESALRLMALLGNDGTHVTYGAMSRRSLKVPNSFLIFRNLRIRGFWVTEWMKAQDRVALERIYRELAELVVTGKLVTPVARVYPIEQVGAAFEHAARDSRNGKVLLQFTKP